MSSVFNVLTCRIPAASGGFDCIICIAKYTLYSQHLKSGQKIQGNPGKVSVILSRPSQASRLVPGSSRARPAIDI